MFKYSAPRLFNKLPNNVKCSDNIVTFKKGLKTFIFMDCYELMRCVLMNTMPYKK